MSVTVAGLAIGLFMGGACMAAAGLEVGAGQMMLASAIVAVIAIVLDTMGEW